MNKNFLVLLVAVILVALHLSVAYKPVRSMKNFRRKPWGYRRPAWQRFPHPRKRPVVKRPEYYHPPQRRPPRSHQVDSSREPFTIEFELPIEYVENYPGRFKSDYLSDDDDYAADDYADVDYADDRQLRVQVVKESAKRLRIKLSRNDKFVNNESLTSANN